MDVASLAFNRLVGLRVEDDSVLLTPGAHHLNHLGTIHAAATYAIAEAASGQYLVSYFPELESQLVVLRSSSLKYRNPASPSGDLCGTGNLEESDASKFLDTFKTRGRAFLEIEVSVTQSDCLVLTGAFNWFATRR